MADSVTGVGGRPLITNRQIGEGDVARLTSDDNEPVVKVERPDKTVSN